MQLSEDVVGLKVVTAPHARQFLSGSWVPPGYKASRFVHTSELQEVALPGIVRSSEEERTSRPGTAFSDERVKQRQTPLRKQGELPPLRKQGELASLRKQGEPGEIFLRSTPELPPYQGV